MTTLYTQDQVNQIVQAAVARTAQRAARPVDDLTEEAIEAIVLGAFETEQTEPADTQVVEQVQEEQTNPQTPTPAETEPQPAPPPPATNKIASSVAQIAAGGAPAVHFSNVERDLPNVRDMDSKAFEAFVDAFEANPPPLPR